MRTPRSAAIITAFDGLLFAWFSVVYFSPITPAVVWQAAGGALTAAIVLPFAALAAVGGLIAARRPDNWVGWLLLGAATSFGIG